MSWPHPAILVLNYNNTPMTIKCLESLIQLKTDYTLYLIDNNSEDTQELHQYYLQVHQKFETEPNRSIHWISNDLNYGYAGGLNQVLQDHSSLQHPYYWILNNDTQVDPEAWMHILKTFEDYPQTGIVGSVLKYPNGSIQTLGFAEISPRWGTSSYLTTTDAQERIWDQGAKHPHYYLNGASFCISALALDKLGPMNDEYFLYYEEVDYCYQARKAGFELRVAPQSIVYHDEGSTTQAQGQVSPELDALMLSNRWRFHQAHLDQPIWRWPALLISLCLRMKRLQFQRVPLIVMSIFSKKYRAKLIEKFQA